MESKKMYRDLDPTDAGTLEELWDAVDEFPTEVEDIPHSEALAVVAEAHMADLRLDAAIAEMRMRSLIAAIPALTLLVLTFLLGKEFRFQDVSSSNIWIQLVPSVFLLCAFATAAFLQRVESLLATKRELGALKGYQRALLSKVTLERAVRESSELTRTPID